MLEGVNLNGQLFNASLQTDGDLKQHKINLEIDGEELSAELALQGGLSSQENLSEQKWSGQFASGFLAYKQQNWRTKQSSELEFSWSPVKFVMDRLCWFQQQAHVCSDSLTFANRTVTGDINISRLPIFEVLSDLGQLEFKESKNSQLNLKAKLNWPLETWPEFTLNGSLSAGELLLENEQNKISWDTLSINAQLEKTRMLSSLTITSEQLGILQSKNQLYLPETPAQLNLNQTGNYQLNSQLNIQQLDLAILAPLLPQLQHSEGTVQGQVFVDFSGGKPELSGKVYVNKAELVTETLGLQLSKIEQTLTFSGTQAELAGTFILGAGKGKVQGSVDWSDALSSQLSLQGNNLSFSDGALIQASVSPDLTFTLAPESMALSGKLEVPSAQIKVESIPDSVKTPSGDVVLVDQHMNKSTALLPVILDVDLAVDPEKKGSVNLQAFGLNSGLSGLLNVQGSAQELSVTGEISLLNGSYQSLGQQLVIQEGGLRFSGPVDSPYLFSKAIRDPEYTEDNVVVGLLVEGLATTPSVNIFSVPEMSQAEALSYLTRGKALAAKSSGTEESMLTGMLLNFGLSKSEDSITAIGKKAGIQDLSVNMTGQGDNATVAVSGSLSDNIRISYGVGVFSAISEVSLRLQLLPQMYIEALSGASNAVDVYYQFDDGSEVPNTKTVKH